ncbi:mannan endo-1,4-beta-mannosidase 6-like [Carex rostrata]
MKERRIYTLLGLFLLIAFIYLTYFSPSNSPPAFKIPIPWLQPKLSFIGRNSTRFVDLSTGEPVYLNGWNSYWLLSAGSHSAVSEMLKRGRGMGMGVCRTWAFSDGGPTPLQISPGRFDETMFQELDFVIYEARRQGIRLILSLVNNLNAFGGKAQYVVWAKANGENVTNLADSFFSHPTIKLYYKNYLKTIVTRKNSYSGIRYSDEPAIFAWELMNEPRCLSNSSAPLIQAWIAEMASYIKTLDKNHLVTVGLEGFYSPNTTHRLGINPGDWAASLCSDFILNSAIENIDFASVHAYPDSWIPQANLEEKAQYLSNWVDSHINDSQQILKKPVLFSEVGSHSISKQNGTYARDILLKIVYDKIYESAKNRGAGSGALIWQLTVEQMRRFDDDFSLIARFNPSTHKLIKHQSCRLQLLFRNNTSKVDQWCHD